MASISGLQNNPTNNLNTIDGLQIINATSILENGQPIDIGNLVPYNGATEDLNMGFYNLTTDHIAAANSDVVNLQALNTQLSILTGFLIDVGVLNFVPYNGSTSNTNLGTYGLSAGAITANSSLTVNGVLNVSGITTLNRGQSSYVPTTGIDLANKTYVDNSVSSTSSLLVPYTGATTLLNLGSNSLTASTAKFTAITSATPSLALGVDALGNLNTFAVPSGASFPFNGTTNINGSLKTIQDLTQYNPTLDANSYFITGISPTTYTFSSPTWIVNPVSGTTANIQLDPSIFYFSTTTKYVISFTGIFGTSASWTGTVYNNSTSTTVSDAPITITTTSQNLTMTFTPGSSNPTIYLRFDGASGTLRITNLSIKQVDTEVLGNLAISSQIDSNIVLANGKTANFANGLKVNQTSVATAPTLTTASLPAGVSASTLSGAYTLTATAGGTTFGMWLGSSFTYIAGAKYTFTFTGFSTNATATQAMIMYVNTYTGGVGTFIGDYIVNVPITSSTISGSFTATSNNNVVFNFVSSASGRSISFSGFTLTRADTEITGIATQLYNATAANTTTLVNRQTMDSAISAGSIVNLNNIFTGVNTFQTTVSTLATTTVSSKAYLTSILQTAGISSQAISPGIISGTYLLTPSPTTAPFASCYSPTNAWITGARYIFRFTGFTPSAFGISLIVYQANVGNTGTVAISASFPVVSGTFTGLFTPNVNPSFLGQVYLQWTGTANKTFSWTSFTYEVGTLEVDGVLDMTGIANINGGTSFAVQNNYMSPGSLTIGDITRDYGGGTGTWNTSTAGLLLECLNNSEIAVHDSGARVASLMYYTGSNNTIRLGRDMGWATSDVVASNNLTANCLVVNGGGTYQAGCIYSDVNWGMLFRAKVAPSAGGGIFGWYDSAGTEKMKMLANGTMTHTAGDLSYIKYGPNTTWNSYLTVGATPDRSGASNAQVISTNGNLHLDAGNSNDIYYGYYPSSRGTPNTHQFYGTVFNFPSGIPQNADYYSQVLVMQGTTLKKSQCVMREIYFSNNVAWGGGVNLTYAFYHYNTISPVQIYGKCSGYYSGAGMMQTTIRIYSQSTGQYFYYPLNSFVNNGYNHFTVPLNIISNGLPTGWFDVYVYSTSGWITDSNDQLTICVQILPVRDF